MDGYIVDELVGVDYSGKIRKIYVCGFWLWFDATIHPYLGNNINERFDIQQRESEHQMVGVEAALLPEAVPLLIYVVVHGLIFLPPSPVNSSI